MRLRLPRVGFYAVAIAIGLAYIPIGWATVSLLAILVTELIESHAARALVAGGAEGEDGFERRWRHLAIAHLTMGSAVGLLLVVAWHFAGPGHMAYPLCLSFVVASVVAHRCRHVPGLMMARQGVYSALVVVLAARNLALGGPLTLSALATDFLPVLAFAGYAIWMAHTSAAAYRSGLEREHQLAETRDAAERAHAAKASLIATISHELRTPLNGIIGMAQTLLAAKLADPLRRQVEVLAESGRSLNALLTDILDFSKLEAGRLTIVPAEDDLRRTVEHIERLYRPVAEQKGLALAVSVDESVPVRLVFDANRVRQCLANLVANAIKFTETGSATVALSAEPATPAPDGAPRHRITLTVTDTGIGIEPERQDHLFEPFTQADGSIASRFGGTGLGLSITRYLAEAMEGDVTLASAPGRGSTFRFSFLAGAVPGEAAGEAAGARGDTRTGGSALELANRRVLVTGDTDTNRMLMRLFLEPLGIEVVEARDASAALEALGRASFDAACIDLDMGGTAGRALAERIRRGEAGRTDLPILAVVGVSPDDDGARPEIFDGLVAKPIDPARLRSALAAAVTSRTERGAPRPEPSPADSS